MAQLVARLVRNEKVGGSNPPSSTTGRHPIRMSVFCMLGVVLWCLVLCCSWRRWYSGRRECFVGPGCLVCPWAAARPRAVRAASCARRVVSKPGQAPPPPTGAAAWPSGALHTGDALGYRTKRVGFMVTFRLFGAEKSVLKLVGADLKDGLNVLVL